MWNISAARLKEVNMYDCVNQKQYGKFSQSIIFFSMIHRQTLPLPKQGHYWAIA